MKFRVLVGQHSEGGVLYGKNADGGEVVDSAMDLRLLNSPGCYKFEKIDGLKDGESALDAPPGAKEAWLKKQASGPARFQRQRQLEQRQVDEEQEQQRPQRPQRHSGANPGHEPKAGAPPKPGDGTEQKVIEKASEVPAKK